MSRKGRMPIPLQKGVQATYKENVLTLKGPKGALTQTVPSEIEVNVEENQILVGLHSNAQEASNIHGLYWALIANMAQGVAVGFEKKLEMVGVGYRAIVQGKFLELQIGLSHPTKMAIPETIDVIVEKNTNIFIRGNDKQRVGQFAADIRAKRPPEPYKGKGIRYSDEFVRRKAGKAGKK